MNTYTINYRTRGNKEATVYETSVTANTLKEATKMAHEEFTAESGYTVISVKRA